jgi:Holliday junction resolvase RusA-like endonuclease
LRNGHTYTPKKTKDYQSLVASFYSGPLFKEAVLVDIELYYQTPKSTKLRKDEIIKELELNNENTDGLKRDLWYLACEKDIIKAIVKPDIDNVSKCILDALNGIAYEDDNQVVELNVIKRRSVKPRAIVRITEV